jgi:phage terminase small subunit
LRGRKPKPTHLKVLAGKPGHRPLNLAEPTPDLVASPKPPRHLVGPERKLWGTLVPVLERMQVLTEADLTALEMLCAAYGDWRRNRTGEAWKRVAAGLAEFGLTPSSRSRVKVLNAGKRTSLAEFIGDQTG